MKVVDSNEDIKIEVPDNAPESPVGTFHWDGVDLTFGPVAGLLPGETPELKVAAWKAALSPSTPVFKERMGSGSSPRGAAAVIASKGRIDFMLFDATGKKYRQLDFSPHDPLDELKNVMVTVRSAPPNSLSLYNMFFP